MFAHHGSSWEKAEQRLGGAGYFGGDELTTADIMMGFPLITMRSLTGDTVAGRPTPALWFRRVDERAAFQRAMAKAEPGMPPNLQYEGIWRDRLHPIARLAR